MLTASLALLGLIAVRRMLDDALDVVVAGANERNAAGDAISGYGGPGKAVIVVGSQPRQATLRKHAKCNLVH